MSRDRRRLLRWYPRWWRDRYEDEMLALLDDELGDGRPPIRLWVSLVAHGLTERTHGLRRLSTAPEKRWQSGSLVVLVAWSAFMVGGAAFSKASEHFDQALPIASRRLPDYAFTVVAIGGVLGGCIVLVGAALAVPAFINYLRTGGGPTIRPHVARALVVSALTAMVTIPLTHWAHQLTDVQRNGANTGYGIAFLGWVALCIASLACWTAVAFAVGRNVDLQRSTVRLEAALATALTAVMGLVVCASIVWWASIASDAPWFFRGAPTGTTGSSFSISLAVAVIAMLAATVLGITGTAHIHKRPPSTADN
jgi:hypothetical protein